MFINYCKICIFIADSAKFKVPMDKYFNKRHKNSHKIFLTFYMNDSSISLYNIYKNQGTFPDDFLRFKPKPPPPYLEIADISNIKQDNPFNKQASFLNMYQIYVSLLSSLYIKIMFTLKYQIMKR